MAKGKTLLAGSNVGCNQPSVYLDTKYLTYWGWMEDGDAYYRAWDTFQLGTMTDVLKWNPTDFMDNYAGYEVSDLQRNHPILRSNPELTAALVLPSGLDRTFQSCTLCSIPKHSLRSYPFYAIVCSHSTPFGSQIPKRSARPSSALALVRFHLLDLEKAMRRRSGRQLHE